MKIRVLFILCAIFLTSACGDEDKIIAPEQIALNFFEAIYVKQDLDLATQYVSTDIAELMEHFQLASQVQINVIALTMTDTTLAVARVEKALFHKENDEVNVLIQFKGKQGEKIVLEDKMVRLAFLNSRWVIVKIYDDQFQVNG